MLGWCLYLASSLKLFRGVRQIYANVHIDASAEIAGFPFAYGVFQNHYSRLPEFEGNSSLLPAIGTTTTVRPRTLLMCTSTC